MSLRTPRIDLHPPIYSRTFATSDGVQRVFANQLEQSGSDALDAPAGINHLPTSVVVSNPTAGALNFVWQDASSTVNTLSIPQNTCTNMPFSIRTIGAASASGLFVTVSWHPEA